MVRDRLAPGGVVVVNVGHPEGSTKLQKALAATMRAAFGSDRVFRDDSEPTNTMLLATTTDADPASSLHAAAVTVPSELGTTLDERRRPAAPGAARRSRLHRRPGAGRVAGRPVAGGRGDREGRLRDPA